MALRSIAAALANIRKRAKTFARGLREDIDKMEDGPRKSRATDLLNKVDNKIKDTYVRNVKSESMRKEAGDALQDLIGPSGRRGPNARADRIFSYEMSAARQSDDTSLGDMGDAKVRIFYASTKHMWAGADPLARNNIIVRETGSKTLEEAYNKVMAQQADALDLAREMYQDMGWTDQSQFGRTAERSDVGGSPTYLDLVTPYTR